MQGDKMPRCIDCQYALTENQKHDECICLAAIKEHRDVLDKFRERKCPYYKLGIMHNVQSRKGWTPQGCK